MQTYSSHEGFIESCRLMLEDRFRLVVSNQKLKEIIGDQMDEEWQECDYSKPSHFALDTYTRESVIEIVTQRYMGRSWPCYGDNFTEKQLREFYMQLVEKINADS